MSMRKRNQWLEAEDEEDEANGLSGSEEEAEPSKTRLSARSAKRRKVDEQSDDDSDALSINEAELDRSVQPNQPGTTYEGANGGLPDSRFAKLAEFEADEDEDHKDVDHEDNDDDGLDLDNQGQSYGQKDSRRPEPAPKPTKAKSKKKSGVVYISRIPPFMKPQTLRSYLSPFGAIGKIFLTPEDHATYIRRKRSGGNKKHSFIDGWVEFLSKRDAKNVAEVLNGNIIGGKKGNYYHDDIWNMKYLRGFKWDDLTEQIARENKERESRLRTEIARAKRENEAFVRDVERGKMLGTMKARKEQRGGRGGGDEGEGPAGEERAGGKSFKQNVARDKRAWGTKDTGPDEKAGEVLSRIFS